MKSCSSNNDVLNLQLIIGGVTLFSVREIDIGA